VGTTRPDTAYATLKLRIKEPLRAEIERAASVLGVSMNAEMQRRLEQSFGGERDFLDDLLADPSLRTQASLMLLNFERAGRAMAEAKGLSTEPRVWMRDSDCYRAACAGAMAACGIATGTARGTSTAQATSGGY
jgi:hypothetical protein